MKIFRILTLLAAFCVLNMAFMNCSMPVGSGKDLGGENKSLPPENQYNGGGYSGKLTYLFFADSPMCVAAPLEPEAKIEYFGGAYLQSGGMCSNNSQANSILPMQNSYNPYYLIHDEKVYFLNKAETALPAGNRVVNYALCSNGAEQIDVAIRIEKVWNAQTNVWNRVVKGQLISASLPFIEEQGRLADPDVNQTVTFGSSNSERNTYTNTFHVRIFNFGSAFKVPGEISIDGNPSRTLPADCYILK